MPVKITYYLAASADGFIAKQDGSVDWLEAFNEPGQDYGYHDFIASVDALIMGRKTYEQVLSFGEWPYQDKPCLVLTKDEIKSLPRPSIESFRGTPSEAVNQLERVSVSHAWMVGGGAIAASFAQAGLIDDYLISVMPCFLGNGIGIFGTPGRSLDNITKQLELLRIQQYDTGVVKMHYSQKKV